MGLNEEGILGVCLMGQGRRVKCSPFHIFLPIFH